MTPTAAADDLENNGSAQYLTANCVLVTYFTGEISQVVDEHFARALQQQQAVASEEDSSGQQPESKEKGESRGVNSICTSKCLNIMFSTTLAAAVTTTSKLALLFRVA